MFPALFAGCSAIPVAVESCDPRELVAGEVRAKRLACEEELIPGGEGRTGDWLIENATSRFVVRDVYGSLTQWGEQGGTLVDAAAVGEPDLLTELLLDADRSTIEIAESHDAAELRLPGIVYHLAADTPFLSVGSPNGDPLDGRWVPAAGSDRTLATVRGDRNFGGGFFATDGQIDGDLPEESVDLNQAGQVSVRGVSRIAVRREARFDEVEPQFVTVNADFVEVVVEDRVVDRVPVVANEAYVYAPQGAELSGAREGCTYSQLNQIDCAELHVRAVDQNGKDLPAAVYFLGREYALPEGGGRAPLGPFVGEAWIWAGPAYSAVSLQFFGEDDEIQVVLERLHSAERVWPDASAGTRYNSGGTVLAALDEQVAPDASNGAYSADLLRALRSAGVGFAVARADGEVPVIRRDEHDDLRVLAATGVRDQAFSWSWSSTTARSAHGTPDVEGFGAVDQLALLRGGAGADRFTVVSPEWVESALNELPTYAWDPRPDALMLHALDDLATLDALLNAWIPVIPLGPRTWVDYTGSDHTIAFEAGIRQGRVSGGNGPRVDLALVSAGSDVGANAPFLASQPAILSITLSAPGWMDIDRVEIHTDRGIRTVELPESGRASVPISGSNWAYAVVSGARSAPWGGQPAWAVSPVVWLSGP